VTHHRNKITCSAASKLSKFVKQENLGYLFLLKAQSQEYFATKGIRRPNPNAFELIRRIGGA
jgi:hypothetical protein